MVKFLDGSGVQSALTDIIKNSNQHLFIISPYLKISIQTKSYLKSIDKKNIPINIVFRTESKINDDDLKFFTELSQLRLGSCENLHSKCYLNEKEGLITSMNLHEHSQTHNWEMGIRFSREFDSELYTDVTKELKLMLSQTKLLKLNTKALEPKSIPQKDPDTKSVSRLPHKPTEAPNKNPLDIIIDTVFGEKAYCIRCGSIMEKYDLHHPFCNKCYQKWAYYKRPTYSEKYCHSCGKVKQNISFAKPICTECYKRLYTREGNI